MAVTLNVPQTSDLRVADSDRLIMTDYGMLFVLFLAVMFAMDPFILYIDKHTIFKHLHLMAAVPVFTLAWVGSRLSARQGSFTSIISICWPLMLLATWIVAGALYARFHNKLDETFLIMGVYMFVTFGAARFIADHHDPTKLLNFYLSLLFIAIVVGAGWQAGYLHRWSEFHEEEFLTVPLAVYIFTKARDALARGWALVLMFVLMLLVVKNTSFMVAALALVYIWWGFVRPRLAAKKVESRLFHYFLLLIFGLTLGGLYAGIKYMNGSALPDGNPKYRLYTYERTWEVFQHSPVWGKSFTGAGAEKFGQFQVLASTQILPSHSDLLDILAQGGLIGLVLFLYGLWRIARYIRLRFRLRLPEALSPTLTAHFHWLAVSTLTAIPVFAFNPIMLQPGKAFLLWVNLGILIGLAIRCAEYRKVSDIPRSYQ